MAKEKKIKAHEYETHKSICEKCNSVNIQQPSTLINCCLIGAPLLRDYLNQLSSPDIRKKQNALKRMFIQDADGKVYKTTKNKLNSVMKFK